MQTRCIHCKKEQYALAVSGVSRGTLACSWCQEYSYPMSETEYLKELNKP